jgi:hypothetical protein
VTAQVVRTETLALLAPLGLRFRDVATGALVGDGLVVTAHPVGRRGPAGAAQTSLTGTYVFHQLPGLRAVERSADVASEDAFWGSPPASADFVVNVDDPLGRYQPFSFVATAPWRGLFSLACGSPASPPDDSVPLFPAPTRTLGVPWAAVRADLWDPVLDRGAAGAVLEVTEPDGAVYRGLADGAGRVLVPLRYPQPFAPGFASASAFSAVSSGLPLVSRAWSLTVRVLYAASAHAVPAFPDICERLAQPEATAWADESRTTPLTEARLDFGRDVVLRTRAGQSPLSTLHVTATP